MSGSTFITSKELIKQDVHQPPIPFNEEQVASFQLDRERKAGAMKVYEEKEIVFKFFKCIVNGQVEKAEGLLKERPDLSLKKSAVTDLSQREYKMMTGFQYALWALDWHMWTMLLEYLPKEAAYAQFMELERAEETTYGKHFNLEPFTKALSSSAYAVRRVQLLLPMHLINKYWCPSNSKAAAEALQPLLPILTMRQQQLADLRVKLEYYLDCKKLLNPHFPLPSDPLPLPPDPPDIVMGYLG